MGTECSHLFFHFQKEETEIPLFYWAARNTAVGIARWGGRGTRPVTRWRTGPSLSSWLCLNHRFLVCKMKGSNSDWSLHVRSRSHAAASQIFLIISVEVDFFTTGKWNLPSSLPRLSVLLSALFRALGNLPFAHEGAPHSHSTHVPCP